MIGVVEIFVGLLLAVAVLGLLARKLHLSYPILFVVGGLLLRLIPKLPKVRLDPELVFLFCLPAGWRDEFHESHFSLWFAEENGISQSSSLQSFLPPQPG